VPSRVPKRPLSDQHLTGLKEQKSSKFSGFFFGANETTGCRYGGGKALLPVPLAIEGGSRRRAQRARPLPDNAPRAPPGGRGALPAH
jgi:hypothetical protein